MVTENTAPNPDTGAPTGEAQATEKVETSSPESANPDGAKAAAPGATAGDEKANRLHEILARVEKKPDEKLNDEDLALFMEYDDGRGKLKPKAPESAPKEKEAKESEKEPKAATPEKKAEKEAPPEVAPHVEAAMKEVGAKTPDELPAKIKELRARVAGKESEAVSALRQDLTRKAENEAALWRDWNAGKPAALEYAEKVYGVKPPSKVTQQAGEGDLPFDPDTDALTGGALSRLHERNLALERKIDELGTGFKSSQRAAREAGIRHTVSAQVVDEMIALAPELDGLKDIPNLRNSIIDRVVSGKEDPRLDAFNELFQVAEEEGISLRQAHLLLQGKKTAFLVAQAEERGRKSAYAHTPNRSLSAVVTEDAQPQTISDEQLKRMETDPNAIPSEWFDAKGNLVKSKIPQKAWEAFGLE